jgi:hypothetical protein
LVIHEALHAVGFLLFKGRVFFGICRNGLYTGSAGEYNKGEYIFILLLPAAVLSLVWTALLQSFPYYFIPFYGGLFISLLGSGADLYAAGAVALAPRGVTVRDDGAVAILYRKDE